MSIIKNFITANVITKSVRIDGSTGGLGCLKKFLSELGQRLEVHTSDKNHAVLSTMRLSVTEIIELAYKDFNAFSEKYECTIGYNEHPEKSNVFNLHLVEKNGCPRDYSFKFTGLRQA